MLEIQLQDWLEKNQIVLNKLQTYAVSPLPKDISERHADMDLALQNSDEAANLLADAESYLAHSKAKAMFDVLKEYPDLTASERMLVIKDTVRKIQRLVDGLAVTHRTIQARIFSSMNANRSRL